MTHVSALTVKLLSLEEGAGFTQCSFNLILQVGWLYLPQAAQTMGDPNVSPKCTFALLVLLQGSKNISCETLNEPSGDEKLFHPLR